MSTFKSCAGIIEEKLGWSVRSRRARHWAIASMPDGELAYLPVVYTGKDLAGKVYDLRREGEESVTVYAENFEMLRRDKVKKIKLGFGVRTDTDGMVVRPTMVAVHPDVASLLRLDESAPTVQHVILEEWQTGKPLTEDFSLREIDWM
jgi:hypothetical protein